MIISGPSSEASEGNKFFLSAVFRRWCFPQAGQELKLRSDAAAHVLNCLTSTFDRKVNKLGFRIEKILLTLAFCSGKLRLGRCGLCDLEHRKMTDGWG